MLDTILPTFAEVTFQEILENPADLKISYSFNICQQEVASCEISYFCFFNNVEYKAQDNIAITIVMSPLLKFKFFKISKLAFVIIIMTYNRFQQ